MKKSSRKKKSAPQKKTSLRSKVAAELPLSPPPRAVVGVIAPSAPAPLVELALGAERLQDAGFEVYLHPQVKEVDAFFAGADAERALAFLDYAFDPELSVLWAARGGYGAIRLLPILDEVITKVGKPEKKTLVGFSDLTPLLEYVRARWGWRVIHGPMPATFHIERVQGKHWKRFTALVAGEPSPANFSLKPVYRPEKFSGKAFVKGEVVGGNLAMIQSVLGTPYAFDLHDKILFLEEVGEVAYRMDRMVQQLNLSGAFEGLRGIVLGTFTDCVDSSPQVYADRPKLSAKARTSTRMIPLRKVMNEKQILRTVFGELGEALGIPVFSGLKVGHGDGPECLELGVQMVLSADGRFEEVSE